jgi:CheY-like chemotaxis protein
MEVLLLSPDLMVQSRVAAAAGRAEIPAPRIWGGREIPAIEDTARIRLVLIDLSSPGLDVKKTVAAVRERLTGASIVAFGPHVQMAKLEAARDAGCDRVISRGQLDRDIQAILKQDRGPIPGDDKS